MGCTRDEIEAPSVRAPTPATTTTTSTPANGDHHAPTAQWTVVNDQRIEHPSGGQLFVYSGAANLERGLPGVVEANRRGPAFGLLGGYFAPRVLATGPAPSDAPFIEVNEAARIRLPGLDVAVAAPIANRLTLTLRGGATLAFPADRTEVQGLWRDRPSFATVVSAGASPGYSAWRADRVFIRTRAGRTFDLVLGCPEVLLIQPLPRGSTSVFLLHLGPRPPPADPIYSPTTPVPEATARALTTCSPTATSTLTIPLP